MPLLQNSPQRLEEANNIASLLAKYGPDPVQQPANTSLLSIMQRYSPQQTELFSSGDRSLRAQIAIAAGRVPGSDPTTLFGTILNELLRPQKALFAGLLELRNGNTLEEAIKASFDEGTTGFGTGSFKRDILFSDILDPDNPSGARSPGLAVLGTLGDLLVDPLIFLPSKVLSAPFLAASKWAKVGISAVEATETFGPGVSKVNSILREAFSTAGGSPAAQAAKDRLGDMRRFVERNRATLVDNAREDAIALKTFADEAGIDISEVKEIIVKHMEGTKIHQKAAFLVDNAGVATRNPAVSIGGVVVRSDEALEDTMIRLYEDYGLKAFDGYTDSGMNRLIADFKPMRQAILRGKVNNLEKSLVAQIGKEKVDELSDIILEFKDRSLERFVFQVRDRVFS